jgi:DNA-binding NarL/FixJ family response regulator
MRVTIMEDQLLTREGLVRLLEAGGLEVVQAVGDIPTLLRSIALDPPDAAILDVRVPPTFTDEGLTAAAVIRQRYPSVAVLVLSQHVELAFAERLLADEAGRVGYLLKDRLLDPDSLFDALRRIVRGESVVDPALVRRLLEDRGAAGPLAQLSEREVGVLAAIAEGLTNAGIARRLVISERTVEVHVQHIFEKLDLGGDPYANRRILAALVYLGA